MRRVATSAIQYSSKERTGLYLLYQGHSTKYAWYAACTVGGFLQLTPPQFDKNGVTGGCQAIYTVYQAPNTTLNDPPVCQNLTYPQPDQLLDVDAQVDNGPMSQYGWVDQVRPNSFDTRATITRAAR